MGKGLCNINIKNGLMTPYNTVQVPRFRAHSFPSDWQDFPIKERG